MKEVWKDIKGYEDLYQVSNFGNVKSLRTNKNLGFSKAGKGYYKVGLSKKGKRKMFFVHRLVAQAFLSNTEQKPCVNHKDCNKLNNSANNLEWITYCENNSYKNHNMKKHISSVIYYLQKDYPNETKLLKDVQKIKEIINSL